MTAPLTPDPTPASSTAPIGGPPPSEPPKEWRAGDNAPPWAKGRTAEEVLATGDQMFKILESFNQQARVAPTPAQPVQPGAFADDDIITGAQLKAYLQSQGQPLAAQAQSGVQLAASSNLGMAQMKHAKEFEKWGPEIHGLLSNVPRENWTLDTIDRIVKIVRSDHLPELVAEETQRALAEQLPTMRSNGAAGSGAVHPVQTSLANVPEAWKKRAEAAGITEDTILDFCRANNQTPDQFFKQFETAGPVMGIAVADSTFKVDYGRRL